MFSRVVSAARGLLAGQEPNASQQPQAESEPQAQTTEATEEAMVTATRRSTFARPDTDAGSATSTPRTGSPAVNANVNVNVNGNGNGNGNGKRKGASSTSDVAETHTNKRRRKKPPVVNGDARAGNDGSSDTVPESLDNNGGQRFRTLQSVEIVSQGPSEQARHHRHDYRYSPASSVQDSVPAGVPDSGSKSNTKAAHVRFGSEDPVSIAEYEEKKEEEDKVKRKHDNGVEEKGKDTLDRPDEAPSEESDDEAPESVSNVAQLKELKDAERKRDEARRIHDQAKKDKRKEREHRLKSQAASKPPHQVSSLTLPVSETQRPKHDEMMSESSATLQGSEVRSSKPPGTTQSLPTMLPDEILNAEPSVRPPTPPRETEPATVKTSSNNNNKLRFLDTAQKPPKDVVVGGTSVRVLDGTTNYPNWKTRSNPTLPPKLSKASRNVRDSWMAGNRNKNVSSGVRRTAGGPSGFVRR